MLIHEREFRKQIQPGISENKLIVVHISCFKFGGRGRNKQSPDCFFFMIPSRLSVCNDWSRHYPVIISDVCGSLNAATIFGVPISKLETRFWSILFQIRQLFGIDGTATFPSNADRNRLIRVNQVI